VDFVIAVRLGDVVHVVFFVHLFCIGSPAHAGLRSSRSIRANIIFEAVVSLSLKISPSACWGFFVIAQKEMWWRFVFKKSYRVV
jgi:hypothetical protein